MGVRYRTFLTMPYNSDKNVGINPNFLQVTITNKMNKQREMNVKILTLVITFMGVYYRIFEVTWQPAWICFRKGKSITYVFCNIEVEVENIENKKCGSKPRINPSPIKVILPKQTLWVEMTYPPFITRYLVRYQRSCKNWRNCKIVEWVFLL